MIQIFLRRTPRLLRYYSLGQAVPVPDLPELVHAVVALARAALDTAGARAVRRPADRRRGRSAQFLVYFLPVPLTSSLMWCWTRKWFQPGGLRLSWRGVMLEIARWPVVLWALVNVVLRIKRDYMITPKGVAGPQGPRL